MYRVAPTLPLGSITNRCSGKGRDADQTRESGGNQANLTIRSPYYSHHFVLQKHPSIHSKTLSMLPSLHTLQTYKKKQANDTAVDTLIMHGAKAPNLTIIIIMRVGNHLQHFVKFVQ